MSVLSLSMCTHTLDAGDFSLGLQLRARCVCSMLGVQAHQAFPERAILTNRWAVHSQLVLNTAVDRTGGILFRLTISYQYGSHACILQIEEARIHEGERTGKVYEDMARAKTELKRLEKELAALQVHSICLFPYIPSILLDLLK